MKRIFVKCPVMATTNSLFNKAYIRALVAFIGFLPGFATSVEHFQSHDVILEMATRHAEHEHKNSQKVTIKVTPPDSRLKLRACAEELHVFWPPGAPKSGSTTLGVECPETRSWKIYVRVVITIFDYIAVISAPVRRGDTVSPDNVDLQLVDISNVPNGTAPDFKQWLDYRYKRQLSPGRPLTLGMIEPPKLVHKGEDVMIINRSTTLTVRMKGTALADGAEGAHINVLNNSSDRIIRGKVVSAGLVQVNR